MKSGYKSINALSGVTGTGEGVDICLVDSIFKDGPGISKIHDAVGSNEELTSVHGSWTKDILKWGAPEAQINCYRVIDDNGEYARMDLLEVFSEILSNGGDFVNLSLGSYKPDCEGNCRECKAAKQLADSGSIVVAAAGNIEQQDGAYCPSKSTGVISTAGFQDLCEFEPYYANRAIWIRKSGRDPDEEVHSDVICCHNGCSENIRQCNRSQRVEWAGNANFDPYIPDVLAPVHYCKLGDDQVYLNQGTSFAASYVVGGLAKLASNKKGGWVSNTRKIKNLIQKSPQKSPNGIPYLDLAYLDGAID